MSYYLFELFPLQRLLPPNGLLGWGFAVLLAAGLAFWLWRQPRPERHWRRKQWFWFLGLLVLVPLSILLVGLRPASDGVLPIPALGSPPTAPIIPLLAAVPWVLAIPLLGVVPGVLLAALSGLLLGLWDTRSPFTLLEMALLATLFAAALRQSYRTRLFTWLRQPLVAAVILSLAYPLVYLLTSFFWAASDPIASLDFALARLVWVSLAVGLPLTLAGAVLQALQGRRPEFAVAPQTAYAAPGERSLAARLLFALGPIVLLAFLALAALSWWSAGRAAERLLGERVSASAQLAADGVPFLLETGQNLILQLAGDTRLADASPEATLGLLQTHLRAVPYFEQLVLLDTAGATVASTPVADFSALNPGEEEIAAIGLAIQGMAFQTLSVPPLTDGATTAQLSFITAVRNANGQVRGVLVGRTGLGSNPFAQPILQSLRSVASLGGQAFLIDGDRRIVIAPTPESLMQPYNGQRGSTALSYEDAASNGARRFVNYLPVTGSNWSVVAQWPARLAQQLALELMLPIILVLAGLAAVSYFFMRYSLRSVTASLQELVVETRRISSGDLDAPLSVKSEDEVGRLAAAFETMRQALKARVDEIHRLLSVSQGLTSSLDVRTHIEPLLNAALASGASAARLVFSPEEQGKDVAGFGIGPQASAMAALDQQIHAMTAKQDRVLLTNPARARLKGADLSQAIAAFSLRDDQKHLGTLWLAYDRPQTFGPEAVHYLETLADQAARAAVNARQFTVADQGRKRLESAWGALSDPVLVADERDQIVYANQAALAVTGKSLGMLLGSSMSTLIPVPSSKGDASPEIEMGGRLYSGKLTELHEGAQSLGKVLHLQDLSSARQAENARSDFLATLSHDLHDPLELTKGYAHMLSEVGDLNQQQAGYVQKIEHNLENISRLASNLLDIERVSGLKGLQVQPFLLAEMLEEVIHDLEPRARQKKIDFSVQKAQGKQQMLEADRTLLQRAVFAVLDNAIKFSPRDELIEIHCLYTADIVTLSVVDHGSGIAPLDVPHIFEAEWGGKRKSSGLVIVRSIVQRHGGRVWVESELGSGSKFSIELPLKQA